MTIPLSMAPPHGFQFKEPDGRPFRLISIETEVDGSDMRLAKELYKHGFICQDVVQRYGWSPDHNHTYPAFLKRDGSVTGGELVLDRINLAEKTHAKACLSVYERMRSLEKAGHIQYNPNCGGHIHMDSEGFGFFDTLRLMINYGAVEEIICRLAGAGKTYGHRTLFKGYDSANFGRGYADPILKGPFRDIPHAFSVMLSQKRMSGLNLSHYKKAECVGCGHSEKIRAIPMTNEYNESYTRDLIDLKRCTCHKNLFTIEWRVWNSQGNPRILYAWIALMQAIHAYSWRPHTSPKYQEFEHIAPLDWTGKEFERVSIDTTKKIGEGLEFMFAEYPLTPEEKDALAYSFMRTPYKGFGRTFFSRLASLPYKPPPYKNQYTPRIGVRTVKVMLPSEQPVEETFRWRGLRFNRQQLTQKLEQYQREQQRRFNPVRQEYIDEITQMLAQVAAERPRNNDPLIQWIAQAAPEQEWAYDDEEG